MQSLPRRDTALLTGPLVFFLLVMLGFPTVLDIVYALSDVSFETIRAPSFSGLSNFAEVLADPALARVIRTALSLPDAFASADIDKHTKRAFAEFCESRRET